MTLTAAASHAGHRLSHKPLTETAQVTSTASADRYLLVYSARLTAIRGTPRRTKLSNSRWTSSASKRMSGNGSRDPVFGATEDDLGRPAGHRGQPRAT
jgi:hypothetical protein